MTITPDRWTWSGFAVHVMLRRIGGVMPPTDDLDRAVIDAAEAQVRARDEAWATEDVTEMCKAISEGQTRLYDAVKARQRALRPARVDVIRQVIEQRLASGIQLVAPGLLPNRIDEALTKWEQEQ